MSKTSSDRPPASITTEHWAQTPGPVRELVLELSHRLAQLEAIVVGRTDGSGISPPPPTRVVPDPPAHLVVDLPAASLAIFEHRRHHRPHSHKRTLPQLPVDLSRAPLGLGPEAAVACYVDARCNDPREKARTAKEPARIDISLGAVNP
jgi:hypothetical protein